MMIAFYRNGRNPHGNQQQPKTREGFEHERIEEASPAEVAVRICFHYVEFSRCVVWCADVCCFAKKFAGNPFILLLRLLENVQSHC